MKQILIATRVFLMLSLLTGLIYPLAVTLAAKAICPWQAGGEIVVQNGHQIGSALIAQKFQSDRYFWGRPSNVDDNPSLSGASNWGPSSVDLSKQVQDRKDQWKRLVAGRGEPPQDLLFASASGLDPDMSPEAAMYQLPRVARARNIDVDRLRDLVGQMTQARQWGILGEPRVNVLRLNMALDDLTHQP